MIRFNPIRFELLSIGLHPLCDADVCSSTGDLPWNASLGGRYPASSLQPFDLYPRPIPALVASGVSPVTLTRHTPLPCPWHGHSYGYLFFQRLAWLLHLQFVQLDAVGDPGRPCQLLPCRAVMFRLRPIRKDRRHSILRNFRGYVSDSGLYTLQPR